MLGSKKWNPKLQHCYVTGGGSGLGLAVASSLAAKGAHVSIVGRNVEKLKTALDVLEARRQSPDQVFQIASHSLGSAREADAALNEIVVKHEGRAPDAVFLCAGQARPKFFVEMTEDDLLKGMEDGYWLQAWTAWAVARMLVRQRATKGKFVFVSSTLGYMSFLGYSSYSPAKHAVRALADTLRSEFQLYGYSVHVFFPPTMFTPGYELENETKPRITQKIEETDPGMTADQAAQALLKGIDGGHAHITGDLITELFRASTRGASPGHNYLWDSMLDSIAHIGALIWRRSVDAKVLDHRAEHRAYLEESGFFRNAE
ncbi:oxidoreductase [Punctularia strigosozonata HHB-11173 SS5]|uniref:oxidoreductase n=1 Tax=Punctularia strigosozonata (strain HHB-11173) TaxID=741275 RepID=UPI0004416754|nr:oxidoreductase [Punctularia strigosozonata HHB-11173 SS5]EIN09286.1 oxidoreductase [Punctularia strigosozonata HHB-11173 SS5]